MNVSDVMTLGAASVHPQSTIGEAIGVMLDFHVSGLPVITERGALSGFLSDANLFVQNGPSAQSLAGELLAMTSPARTEALKNRHVDAIMHKLPITIAADAKLECALKAIEGSGVPRLAVMSDGVLVGVLSRTDLLALIAGRN